MLAPDSTILSCPEQRLPGNWLLAVPRPPKKISFENSLQDKSRCPGILQHPALPESCDIADTMNPTWGQEEPPGCEQQKQQSKGKRWWGEVIAWWQSCMNGVHVAGDQASGCEGKGMWGLLAGELHCICALGPHQCQHRCCDCLGSWPESSTAQDAAEKSSSSAWVLSPPWTFFQLKLLFHSVWFPWAILSCHLIPHCLYILCFFNQKGKQRLEGDKNSTRGWWKVQPFRKKETSILRWEQTKDQRKHGNVLVLDRMDSFCLAASWVEICSLPVRLLWAGGQETLLGLRNLWDESVYIISVLSITY